MLSDVLVKVEELDVNVDVEVSIEVEVLPGKTLVTVTSVTLAGQDVRSCSTCYKLNSYPKNWLLPFCEDRSVLSGYGYGVTPTGPLQHAPTIR